MQRNISKKTQKTYFSYNNFQVIDYSKYVDSIYYK